jgi:hypothetical protein
LAVGLSLPSGADLACLQALPLFVSSAWETWEIVVFLDGNEPSRGITITYKLAKSTVIIIADFRESMDIDGYLDDY